MTAQRGLLILLMAAIGAVSLAARGENPGSVASPVSPRDSLELLAIPAGLRVELVAHEPQVVDPVAARFDEDGRLWVVEMRDYPHPPADGSPPKSRIKLLEDRDGDGYFETAHVFADELLFATGVQPWLGGVIVTLSGKIVFMQDTDGDHRADVATTWFEGFTAENPQLRANHPRFALDNRVYVASGLRGGMVISPRSPQREPLPLSGRDLRFDPRSDQYETITGSGQFGVTFDDWGNRFLVSNRNPLMHVVLSDRELARNPRFAPRTVVEDVAAAGEKSRVYPLVDAWTTSNLHAGQFTAACGVDIFRGDALPAEYRGNGLTCEPTGSLVHREIVTSRGATFTARPAYEDREFIASRDSWFRPVNLDGGPDGALYVVDMYRAVIEHPQFMPIELQTRPDLRDGDDRGRIYRIVSAEHERPNYQPRLSQVATRHLVKFLEHDNAWWRETAARLIYERQDVAVLPGLEALLDESEVALARSHALHAMNGLDQLTNEHLLRALRDESAGVRGQAIVLATPRLLLSESLLLAVLRLDVDPDPRVRFEVARALGGIEGSGVVDALARIAIAGADDVWTRGAVSTALAGRAADVTRSVLAAPELRRIEENAPWPRLVQDLAALVASDLDADSIVAVAQAWRSLPEPIPQAGALGVAQGLKARGSSLSRFRQQHSSHAALVGEIDSWLAAAVQLVTREQATLDSRLSAGELLAQGDFARVGPPLIALCQRTTTPPPLRVRVLASLAPHDDPSITQLLLDQVDAQTPLVRSAVLDALLAQPVRIHALLDAVAAGRFKPTVIDPLRAQNLLKHRDAAIVERVRTTLAAALPADRSQALADYQACLTMNGDPRRGREVFRKHCSVCHRIGEVGIDVGPSIGDTRTKTPAQLLTDILLPNRAIDNNYMSYTVLTGDGTTHTGIVTAETDHSVTMKLPEGKLLTLLRENIDQLQSNGVSLMPEGLERNIPLADMADCLSFLKNWRYLDQAIPLGTPSASGSR